MTGFRVGRFEREKVGGLLRGFVPHRSFERLQEIDLGAISASGKRLVLLDVDNTLLPWRGDQLPEESVSWVAKGHALGLHFCLISNTRNHERLRRFATELGITHQMGKFKPSKHMFEAAMREFGVTSDQTVMIGDQLLTDVLGANRSGIDAYAVRPISGREFVGTKANRLVERGLWSRIHRVMETEEDDLPIVEKTGFFESRVARQFAKFCIVGGTSFVIDNVLRWILLFKVPSGDELASVKLARFLVAHYPAIFHEGSRPTDPAVSVAAVLAGCVAILNSFYWNRKWTFGIHGNVERKVQFRRFFVLSIGVLLLNAALSGAFNHVIPGHATKSLFFATLIATFIGAICNFIGQRFWAFRSVETAE